MSGAIGGSLGKESSQQSGTSQLAARPEDLSATMAQRFAFDTLLRQQQNQGSDLSQQARNQQAQLGTDLTLQQFNPQFATALDPTSRGLVSQGLQQQQAQTAAQIRGLQQQFGGQGGVAQALGRQAGFQNVLAGNQLPFQAMASQQQRELGQQGLGLQAAQLNTGNALAGFQAQNQARLQQQQAGQQARAEQFGYGQQTVANNQNLLTMLSQLMEQLGNKQTTGTGETYTKGIKFDPSAAMGAASKAGSSAVGG